MPKQDGKDASSAASGKMFPKPFGIDRQRVRIKASAEEILKGAFLPFTLGQHTCSIVFEDASCGKFVYEITGDTNLPQPFNKFKFQVSSCTATIQNIDSMPACTDAGSSLVNEQLMACKFSVKTYKNLQNILHMLIAALHTASVQSLCSVCW